MIASYLKKDYKKRSNIAPRNKNLKDLDENKVHKKVISKIF